MTSPFPYYAFHVLESHLKKVPLRYSLSDIKSSLQYTVNDPPSPLFITWSIGPQKQLRGCIGTFSPQGVEGGIKEYALIAATEDHRFSPVTLKELPDLSVGVTLLQNFEDGEDAYDWVLGKHGIRISFNVKGRKYGATFLPEVATEQGWDKEETLKHLVSKAGFPWAKLDVGEIKLIRYEGIKSKCDYEEYQKLIGSL